MGIDSSRTAGTAPVRAKNHNVLPSRVYDKRMAIQSQPQRQDSAPVESPRPELYASRILPAYDDLVTATRVLSQVSEINTFSFTVFYQNNGALTHQDVADAVLAAALRSVSDALINTGINYLHAVDATSQRATTVGSRLDGSKSIVSISLPHSVFHFGLRIFDDRLVVSRESSSFRDFYEWYRLFMPNASQLEATVRQAVARKSGQPTAVTQTQFDFKLLFSDFRKENWLEDRPPRNVDVLSEILPKVPNQSGLTELAQQEFMRLDLTLARLERFKAAAEEKWRSCWYQLEAPSNERSRFIVFTSQLRNVATEKIGDGAIDAERPTIPFDPDFSEDYYLAIVDFLKVRALENFMGRMLENWKFSTQRQL